MALFDIRELEQARERAQALGVRTVWRIDLPDISGTHLHPSDMRGTIVSLDRSLPYGSWRWGGPDWTGRAASGPPGRLTGITVAVADPKAAAVRWGEVLGVPVQDSAQPRLALDGGEVRFVECGEGGPEGVVEISVAVPETVRGGRDRILAGAARITLAPLDESG
jgi:hypothetical protein